MADSKTVHVFCAQPLGDEVASDTTIRIHVEVPEMGIERGWEQAYRDMYRRQATKLKEALVGSLPGGTVDALLVALLDHKRCLLAVPMFGKTETEEGGGEEL